MPKPTPPHRITATAALLTFPPPAVAVSANQAHRMHGARLAAQLAPWRDAAYWAWVQAHPRRGPEGRRFRPATVRVSIPFPKLRRRDPHNYTSTVVKAVVDGLRIAGAWPDDTAEWVTVLDPRLTTGSLVRVELVARTTGVRLLDTDPDGWAVAPSSTPAGSTR